ncbi:uncharacterized protein LY79DRAFT_677840 [Colletotrichum navitas]|uniref:Uncharacterized protein n=1 Tax=Colletotrichum navitas TaxID=681940 RepID=A0AAD8PM96_9PEZI|nr:uncharacterized protein LY79DRAFT_677840 [Colletotrichum navitas]KAK1570216.1 hypothetical protein LY79DRAFT_677840 [Colletotrichum navitas]
MARLQQAPSAAKTQSSSIQDKIKSFSSKILDTLPTPKSLKEALANFKASLAEHLYCQDPSITRHTLPADIVRLLSTSLPLDHRYTSRQISGKVAKATAISDIEIPRLLFFLSYDQANQGRPFFTELLSFASLCPNQVDAFFDLLCSCASARRQHHCVNKRGLSKQAPGIQYSDVLSARQRLPPLNLTRDARHIKAHSSGQHLATAKDHSTPSPEVPRRPNQASPSSPCTPLSIQVKVPSGAPSDDEVFALSSAYRIDNIELSIFRDSELPLVMQDPEHQKSVASDDSIVPSDEADFSDLCTSPVDNDADDDDEPHFQELGSPLQEPTSRADKDSEND